MDKIAWLTSLEEIDIITQGGYTYEQVMDNINCSKNAIYWRVIKRTKNTLEPRMLFLSTVAESMELFYTNVENPIRNTNQIYLRFLDSNVFCREANNYKTNGCYVRGRAGMPSYEQYWDLQEDFCTNGVEIEGVRITGRYYFTLNFGRIQALPIDMHGNKLSDSLQETFLRFLDHQYYLTNEWDKAALFGVYKDKELYLDWFPLKTEKDFRLLKKKGHATVKGRRKGFSYTVDNTLYAYNFTFIPYSTNFLFAYQKNQYKTTLDGIHTTLNWLLKTTEFGRRKGVHNTRDSFRASFWQTDEYGTPIENGYMSQIEAKSFKDDPFKSAGAAAYMIGVEEAGLFPNLLETYAVSIEPLIRVGETYIGNFYTWGCIMKDYKVWDGTGNLVNIQDLNANNNILGFDNGVSQEPITNYHTTPIIKPCYELTTNTGYKLGCSDDHPILCATTKYTKRGVVNDKRTTLNALYQKVEWKETKDLKVGDRIAVIDEVNIFGDVDVWQPRLIGMLIGDGNYAFDGTVRLHNADSEILNYAESRFETSFSPSEAYATKDGRLFKSLRIKNITKKLRELGIFGQTKDKKRLPKDIFNSTKYNVTELIAGLFDTDGEVIIRKGNWLSINLNAAHIEIIEEVKFLLSKLGIHAAITFIKPRLNKKSGFPDVNGYYRLSISDYKSVVRFYENIKLLVTAKQNKLNKVEEFRKLHKAQEPYKVVMLNDDSGEIKELTNLRFNTIKSIDFVGDNEVYNLTANKTNTYIASNIITHNSAGDMEGGGSESLKKIIYQPEVYGCLAYDNIYEEQPRSGKVGWFISDTWYAPSSTDKEDFLKLIEEDKDLYKFVNDTYDEIIEGVDIQGNSHHWIARAILLDKRKKAKRGSSRSYQKLISQQPLYITDAFLIDESSPFDTATATMALSTLETNESEKGVPCRFGLTATGKPELIIDNSLIPVDIHPIPKDFKTDGAWIIYSKPDASSTFNYFRYVGACDTIDFGYDETSDSGEHSMAVTWIMDLVTKEIVAVYAGRPPKAEDYYEQLWRGVEFYDAQLLYENNLKGLYSYFAAKNKLYLLADEPSSLKDRWGYKSNNRIKGFHATSAINSYARSLINRWCAEEIVVGQEMDGTVVKTSRMFTIPSKALLQQLIAWNPFGNYDWVSAFMGLMLILYDKEALIDTTSDNTNPRLNDRMFQKFNDKYVKNNNVWSNLDKTIR